MLRRGADTYDWIRGPGGKGERYEASNDYQKEKDERKKDVRLPLDSWPDSVERKGKKGDRKMKVRSSLGSNRPAQREGKARIGREKRRHHEAHVLRGRTEKKENAMFEISSGRGKGDKRRVTGFADSSHEKKEREKSRKKRSLTTRTWRKDSGKKEGGSRWNDAN